MAVREDPETARAGRRLRAAASRAELASLLTEQRMRADRSLRELEVWAKRAGGVPLPRATVSDMLAGRRFPGKTLMVTFLRGCHVPAEHLAEWERAWARVRLAEDGSGGRRTRLTSVREVREHKTAWLGGGLIVIALLALTAVVVFWRAGHGTASPPPGRTVDDDGRAFGPGGSSTFTVTVDPANAGVRLTRRLDAGIGLQAASITVNGVRAGMWQPLPGEPTYRWMDESVEFPARLTAGRGSLTITNTFVSSTQDFNEFTYFVDQRVGGGWSRAGTVDVGPAHPADEAAHHYRIIGQTYAGSRVFDYPR